MALPLPGRAAYVFTGLMAIMRRSGLAMRARRIAGVKRITVIGGGAGLNGSAVSNSSDGASEKLKFAVVEPNGRTERGALRVDLGPVKKERKRLKPIERRLRKLIRSEHRALGRYLTLHDRSRRKRRSGWAGDLRKNLAKVIRRA
jgi:hypothetical protein